MAGIIPATRFNSVQRYYTQNQINKIGAFYDHLKTLKYLKDPERRKKVLSTYSSLMSTGWDDVTTSGEER